jgi:hypothetical protein
MSNRTFNDLRSDVVGRSTHGSLLLLAEFQLGCQSEIPNLDLHIDIEEDIAEFEIAVDNTVAVHVLHGGDELQHEVPGLLGG